MRKFTMGLLLCALLAFWILPAAAAEDENVITAYDARWTVDEHGTAAATIQIEMTLPQAVTELDFPIGAGTDGSLSGRETKAVDTDEGTVLRLSVPEGLSGQQSFTLTYTIPHAVADINEGQKLTLDVIAPGWSLPMSQASFTVTMPAAFSAKPTFVGGYYGDAVGDYLTTAVEGAVLTGSAAEALRDHDSLTVTLELPADYVDLQSANGISGLVTLILVAVLAAGCVFYWYRTLRNGGLSIRLRPMAPDGAGAGDLPMLLTCRAPSLALQVMHWASLGYLAIHINAKGRIVLRKTMDMGTERRKTERSAFQKLFEKEPWCDGESLRFGRLSGRYADAMERWWKRRLFSKTSGSPAILHALAALGCGVALLGSASAGLPVGRIRGVLLVLFGIAGTAFGWLIQRAVVQAARRQYKNALLCALPMVAVLVFARLWGGLIPAALALALQLFAGGAALRGGRRSPGGRDNLSQSLGFRRYVQHVSRHQLMLQLRDDNQYFYNLLPFAEAMGLGAELASRLSDLELEPCAWFESQRRPPQTAPGFQAALHETLERMEQATKKS